MFSYAAVLGHQPHVSLAELAASVPGFSLEKILYKDVALFSSTASIDAEQFAAFGGSIVLAERITEADVSMDDVPQILSKEVSSVKKKVTFGLRCYGIPKAEIKKAYRLGKEKMKNQNRPCRYIGNEKKAAATALLLSSDILSGKKGAELFLVGLEEELWVGRTIAAQDINAYTWRDMEKPVRDTTVGLLPPKLAQIMLNFGAWMVRESLPEEQKKKDAARKRKKKEVYTVLDPFCGTGVIPLECMLRGWNVVASDVSQKAVTGTQKNVDWMRKEKKILKKDVTDTVSKHDATKPFKLKTQPDMVVTETTLGPAIEKKLTKADANKNKKENEKLQEAFLKNAAETLPGLPLVCTWPFWRLKGETIRLEKVWKAVDAAGYQAVLPAGIDITDPERLSILYQRKDQFVGREIVLLLPKKS